MSDPVETAFKDSILVESEGIHVVDLVATNQSVCQWRGGIGSVRVSSGIAYFTVKCSIEEGSQGIIRLGWTQHRSCILGKSDKSMGYGSTGRKSHDDIFTKYGRKYSDGDIIGCFFDFDKKRVGYFTNGEFEGYAFTKDDFSAQSKMFESGYYPAYQLKNATAEFNFGANSFSHELPSFEGLVAAPLQIINLPLGEKLDRENSTILFEGVEQTEMLAENRTKKWMEGTRTRSVYSKNAYFEATISFHGKDGTCLLGWSKRSANFTLGIDNESMCYVSNGSISHDGISIDWGTEASHSDVIGCYLDLNKKLISFSRNEIFLGVAFIDHMFDINLEMFNGPLYPAFGVRMAGIEFNFGATGFQYESVTSKWPYTNCSFKTPVIDWQYGVHKNLENPNQDQDLRNTRLHFAAYHNKYYLVRQLIRRRANVELRNNNDKTPLDTAVNTKNYEIAFLLLKEGKSDILAMDENGERTLDRMGKDWKENKLPFKKLIKLVSVSGWAGNWDFYMLLNSFWRGLSGPDSPPHWSFEVVMKDGRLEGEWKCDISPPAVEENQHTGTLTKAAFQVFSGVDTVALIMAYL